MLTLTLVYSVLESENVQLNCSGFGEASTTQVTVSVSCRTAPTVSSRFVRQIGRSEKYCNIATIIAKNLIIL